MISLQEFIGSFTGGLWFPRSYQTLGIPRTEMPQVQAEHVLEFLKWSGFKYKTTNCTKPSTLKATQREFNMDKVAGMMDARKHIGKPIMVSRDKYVVDGHHRWLAAVNLKEPIAVYVIDAPIHDILNKIQGFPKTFSKNINEEITP